MLLKQKNKSQYHYLDSQQNIQNNNEIKQRKQSTQTNQNKQSKSQPSFWVIVMIGYLYFLQGLILSIGGTMPFIYPQLPNYSVLALFSMAAIPFSFKFLSAPFVQKYNSPIYGKRKSWMVISQSLCSIILFVGSYFTDPESAQLFAFILMLAVFLISLQDIALDALAIKQITSTSLTALIQSSFMAIGAIFGGLILLKLTSLEFAQSFLHMEQPIALISTILKLIALSVFAPTIIIHYMFKETILDHQIAAQSLSICQTINFYKIFFDVRSKHCRFSILLLIMNQGFLLCEAGYEYELVKAGFSKNDLNTLGNIIAIPITILSCFMSTFIQKIGIKIILISSMLLAQTLFIYAYIFFPTDFLTIAILISSNAIFSTLKGLALSMIVIGMPVTAVTGMMVTMMYSAGNLGKNTAIHLKLTGIFGWTNVSFVGLVIQSIIIAYMKKIYEWIEKGEIGVEGKIVQIQISEYQNELKQQNIQM